MGELELKTALLHEGEERIREIWHQSEKNVRKRRQQIQEELAQLRQQSEGKVQLDISSFKRDVMAQAKARAMEEQLQSEAQLAQRLFELAKQVLNELMADLRDTVWHSLCQELPHSSWANIRIHPRDLSFAERDFPAANIELKEHLIGGMVVLSEDERICIDNTLLCRLVQAWPDILPELMNDLRKKVDSDATALNDKSF